MLVDVFRREGVEAAVVGVVDAAGEQGGRVGVGRLPALRVVPAAGAQEMAGAGADVLQADGAGEAGEQADRAGGVGGLLQPREEGVAAGEGEPVVEAVADDVALVDLDDLVDDVLAVDDVAGGGAPGDAAGQHVGRVGPLAAEQGDQLDHLAAGGEGAAHHATLERREGRLDVGGQGLAGVARVHEVGSEEQEALAQVALHVLGHQAQVAHQRGVGRDRQAGQALQGQGRGVQVGGAADAAHPRRDHQAVFRGAADQELLEAAEQGADAAGVHHPVAVEVHLELQVAFDAVEVDVEGDARHAQGSISRFLTRLGAAAWARFL